MTLRSWRRLAGLALLGVGAVHLQQYLGAGYSAIPTIGVLFLLNAIAAGLVGLAMIAPLAAVLDERAEHALGGALAAIAALIAIGSLVALFISESTTLFGFSESGYRTAIVVAIVFEVITALIATPVAVASLARAARLTRSRPRSPAREGERHRGPRDATGVDPTLR